jgi:hypothetical protein
MSAKRFQANGYLADGSTSTVGTTIKVISHSKRWKSQKKWFSSRIVDRPIEYSYTTTTLQIEAITNGLKPQIQLKDLVVTSKKLATRKIEKAGRPNLSYDLPLTEPTWHKPAQLIPIPSCKVNQLSHEQYQSED